MRRPADFGRRMMRGAPAWLAGLGVGVAAGWLCSRIGTPIPWMLGPLVALAALRVSGVPVAAPPGGRQAGQWIIGTALGLYFTPQVVHEMGGWWPWLVAGVAFAIASGYASGLLLARLAGIDRTTAIFASVPGGASEMAIVGERFGARTDRVAAAQSVRILIVVVVLPAAFTLLGLHGGEMYVPGAKVFDPGGFALLMAATAAGGALIQWLGVSNAFVLGSLAVAIPLTAGEIDLSAVPAVVSNAGQCLLGCALGARFEPAFLRGAHRFMAAIVATVLAAMAAAAGFGVLVGWMSGLGPATVVLGTAPGGFAEMCITAKVLQLGVPVVTAFHVARVVVLLLVTAPLFAALRRRRAGAGRR